MSFTDNEASGPATQLAPYLRPGEQLLWSGRPDPDIRFTSADVFLVPFSILWGGFALFWETTVIASGAPPFFVLWGVPFVVLGLYFMFGRFVYKRRNKLRTAYGLTTDRALVAVGTTTLHETPVEHTPKSIRRSPGHVSITFGNPGTFGVGTYANTGMDFFGRGNAPIAFYDVADGDALLAILNRPQDVRDG
jgi:hypothetical protein